MLEFTSSGLGLCGFFQWTCQKIKSNSGHSFCVFCEMGEKVTNQCKNHANELGHFEWYLFPMKLQRIHINVLAIANKPANITGFGTIVCTRQSMKMVITF